MARCKLCGRQSRVISEGLNLCFQCIKEASPEAEPYVKRAQAISRQEFNLPVSPPDDLAGRPCRFCLNQCRLAQENVGYCGLRKNMGGKIIGGGPKDGNVSWYYDPLPTNCVADWVCPGVAGAGFPEYSHSPGPEYGYKNLAVFYQACTFNCLFCQNWHYRHFARKGGNVSAQALASQVDVRTSCICYFGGAPTPQLGHAIAAARLAREDNKGKILRICWESNGSMNRSLLKEAARLSMESGGCIKFDLKAYD